MRTPEEGHTLECLSRAVIAAVENKRDALKDAMQYTFAPITRSEADHDFTLWLQDDGPRSVAFEYLQDGTISCACPPAVTSDADEAMKAFKAGHEVIYRYQAANGHLLEGRVKSISPAFRDYPAYPHVDSFDAEHSPLCLCGGSEELPDW